MRRIHRDIVGTFIFSNDGYLLLGKSRKGGVYKDFWIIPGGGIEQGETKLEAARRETLEEVGIDINDFDVEMLEKTLTGESEKVLKVTDELVVVDMTFFNFVVHADKPAADIQVVTEDDLIDPRWHKIKDLKSLNLSPPTETTLKNLGLV